MEATVSSKGQVTIPVEIRHLAKITAGSKLDFQMEEDGTVKISLLNLEISELKGIVQPKKRKPVSIQEMKKAIKKGSMKAMQ